MAVASRRTDPVSGERGGSWRALAVRHFVADTRRYPTAYRCICRACSEAPDGLSRPGCPAGDATGASCGSLRTRTSPLDHRWSVSRILLLRRTSHPSVLFHRSTHPVRHDGGLCPGCCPVSWHPDPGVFLRPGPVGSGHRCAAVAGSGSRIGRRRCRAGQVRAGAPERSTDPAALPRQGRRWVRRGRPHAAGGGCPSSDRAGRATRRRRSPARAVRPERWM
jgi:hypothetical protein